jgi:hypothetical protein
VGWLLQQHRRRLFEPLRSAKVGDCLLGRSDSGGGRGAGLLHRAHRRLEFRSNCCRNTIRTCLSDSSMTFPFR